MKKIFLSALILFGLVLSFQPNAHADYPRHINGDPDYILTYGIQGVGFYVQRSSLSVELYDPPIYVLSIKVYTTSDTNRGNTRPGRPTIMIFAYDWNKREMYELKDDGEWSYVHPRSRFSDVAIGEMTFYIAYGKKFYGQVYDSFSDEFYRRY